MAACVLPWGGSCFLATYKSFTMYLNIKGLCHDNAHVSTWLTPTLPSTNRNAGRTYAMCIMPIHYKTTKLSFWTEKKTLDCLDERIKNDFSSHSHLWKLVELTTNQLQRMRIMVKQALWRETCWKKSRVYLGVRTCHIFSFFEVSVLTSPPELQLLIDSSSACGVFHDFNCN